MKGKAIQALEKLEFLKQYTGIQVDDHETALYHFGTDHGECNIHLLRYLKKNTEEIGNQWSNEMADLLCEMNRERKSVFGQGIPLFPEEVLSGYEQRYTDLLAKGRKENRLKCYNTKKEEKALLTGWKNTDTTIFCFWTIFQFHLMII